MKRSQVRSSSRADAERASPPTWGEEQRGARPFLLAVLPDWFLLPSSPPAVPSKLWGQILSIPRLAVWAEEDPSPRRRVVHVVPEGHGKGLGFSCRLFTKCQDRLRKQFFCFFLKFFFLGFSLRHVGS